MRASFINKLPTDWLKDNGEEPLTIHEVLSSFAAMPKVCLYRSEHLFLRFHEPHPTPIHKPTNWPYHQPRPIYAPNYWADGSLLANALARAGQFKGFLTDQEITRVAKSYYRELAAICHDWKRELKYTQLWKIQLRGGEELEGLEGPTAAQPTFFKTPLLSSIFRGGGIQVYLYPKTPFVCTPVNWSGVA